MGEASSVAERDASRAVVRCAAFTRALLTAVLALGGVATAQSQDAANEIRPAPGLIVGGSYTLPAGTTLHGDLNVVGASVAIATGGTLDGQLVAIGGTTALDGTVTGDVHAYGGALSLGERATIGGDLSTEYAAFERSPGAVVAGQLRQGTQAPLHFSLPTYVRPSVAAAGRAVVPASPLDVLFRALALGLLAMLVMALAPARVTRVRDAILRRPVRMGFDGLLTGIVVTLLLVLLAVTLVGIPLTVLGFMLLYASVLFGWIAFGDAVGEYLAEAFEQHWNRSVRVAVGAFALALAAAALAYVPVLGAVAGAVMSMVALGAVRATRYGGREPGRREVGPPPEAAPQA